MFGKNVIYIVSIILLQAMLLITLFQSLHVSSAMGYMADNIIAIVPYLSYIVITLTIITAVTVSRLSLLARKQQE